MILGRGGDQVNCLDTSEYELKDPQARPKKTEGRCCYSRIGTSWNPSKGGRQIETGTVGGAAEPSSMESSDANQRAKAKAQ